MALGDKYGRSNPYAALLAPEPGALGRVQSNAQGVAYALQKGLQGLFAGMDAKDQSNVAKAFGDAFKKDKEVTMETGAEYNPDLEDANTDVGSTAMAPVVDKGRSYSERLMANLGGLDSHYAGDAMRQVAMQQMAQEQAARTAATKRGYKVDDATTVYNRQKEMALEKERLRIEADKRKLTNTRETNKIQAGQRNKDRMTQIAQQNTNRRELGSTDQQNYRFAISQIPPGQPKPTFAQYQERMKLINQGIIPNPNAPAQQPAPPPQQFMQHDNGMDTVGQQVQGGPYNGPMPSQTQGMPNPAQPAPAAQPAYKNVEGGTADRAAKMQEFRQEQQRMAQETLRLQQVAATLRETASAQKQRDAGVKSRQKTTDLRRGVINRMQRQPIIRSTIEAAKKLSDSFYTSGRIGQASEFAGGTDSDMYKLKKAIGTIQSNIGLNELISIKKAGGTFGSLTTSEMDLLISSAGSLDHNQDPKILKPILTEIMRLYEKGTQGMKDDFERVYPNEKEPWKGVFLNAPGASNASSGMPNIPPPPPGARVIGQ